MESWDVIVIGGEVSSMDDVNKKITEAVFLSFFSGGISGLFAAYQLLKEGSPRVLLLEVNKKRNQHHKCVKSEA